MSAFRTITFRLFAGFGAMLLPFFLGSCASPSDIPAMTAAPMKFATKYATSVSVTVSGGAVGTTLDASTIGGADFAAAIKASLTQSGLFAKVVPAGQSEDYELVAVIARVDQPVIGPAMTATIEVNWTLTRLSNRYVFWNKTLITSSSADAHDAFAGIDRLRIANEGAARVNLQDALTQISVLNLP